MVPFTNKPTVIDKNLSDKLKAEWPSILAWAIRGCVMWLQDGLAPPKAVMSATEEYFHSEDPMGRWMEERCAIDGNLKALVGDLFKDWREWCGETGEFVGSEKRFSQMLASKGFSRYKDPYSRKSGFVGLELLSADFTDFGPNVKPLKKERA
jgi:putative DNA primase/helicase